MEITIRKASEADLAAVVKLSQDWEAENSTHGYTASPAEEYADWDLWVLQINGEIAGYASGYEHLQQQQTTVVPSGTRTFELEELYIKPEFRSQGLGTRLLQHVEQGLTSRGITMLLLSTANKDHRAALNFYIDQNAMSFWNARLYKRLKEAGDA